MLRHSIIIMQSHFFLYLLFYLYTQAKLYAAKLNVETTYSTQPRWGVDRYL